MHPLRSRAAALLVPIPAYVSGPMPYPGRSQQSDQQRQLYGNTRLHTAVAASDLHRSFPTLSAGLPPSAHPGQRLRVPLHHTHLPPTPASTGPGRGPALAVPLLFLMFQYVRVF